MHKNILAVGITFLFIILVVTPMTIGYNVRTSDSKVLVKNYKFDRYFLPEFYDCYNIDEIPDSEKYINREYSDNDNNYPDIVINSDKTPQPTDSPPMESPWPMYCHDVRHTGRSQFSTLDNPYDEKWRFKLSEISYHCAPVIDNDGIIYVGRGDLFAVFANGSLKWEFEIIGIVRSAPAIDEDGILYIGSEWADSNYLYAIHTSNGNLKWKYFSGDSITSSPVIGNDGTIYFGNWNGDIHAVYPNGTRKWIYHTGDIVTSSPAIGPDDTIYVGSHDDYVYALYPNNGTVKWRYNTGSWVHGSATIGDDGTVYIGSDNGYLYAFYPNNRTIKWRFLIGATWCSPALNEDGIIYVGTWGMKFYALYPNGTIKWVYNAPGRIWFGASTAVCADGIIYFGTTWMDGGEGAFIVLNPDGTERFIENTSLYETSPAIGKDGTVYTCSSH